MSEIQFLASIWAKGAMILLKVYAIIFTMLVSIFTINYMLTNGYQNILYALLAIFSFIAFPFILGLILIIFEEAKKDR